VAGVGLLRACSVRGVSVSSTDPVVRLVREPLLGGCDPVAAARWLRGEPRAVALSGAWCGGGTLLSSHPLDVAAQDDDPFEVLGTSPLGFSPAAGCVELHVGGGWFGWLGFGLAAAVEALPPAPPRAQDLPLFDLAFHDHVVRCDPHGEWWFEALWTGERAAFLSERLEFWRERVALAPPPARPFSAAALRPTGAGLTGHRAAVAEAVARIAVGEFSQANICLQLETDCDGDPLDLWVRATTASRPAYAAYIASASAAGAVVSLSPELFLQRRDRCVQTRPIKGTAPQSHDPSRLESSEKDRAENVMIVDLMRNDLGRVCRYGSVTVEELCGVRPGAGVWHLESTVSGELRADVGDRDLLRATFPPGSVTGAPKVQALRTIHQLESTARQVYCGAIGLCSPASGLELSVAIRTLEVAGRRLWLGVGGGVVSDSSPSDEVDEALDKARGVVAAAGLKLSAQPPIRTPAIPISRLPRPDPNQGVFETIRVGHGRAICSTDHLARLLASCQHLSLPVPDDLETSIAIRAAELCEGAIRITVTDRGSSLDTRKRPPIANTLLAPIALPGGLGAHKWNDRTLIDAHTTNHTAPLICDIDGTVLEVGYAALLLAIDNQLIAPPLDGRILPSISRQHTLRVAKAAGWRIAIHAITLTDLRTASAIILTSSLRGPHLGKLRGAPLPPQATKICAHLQNA
jgi:para-aminobenzoate synthetase / 4-amino-4-deoxychorismate lyase